MKKLLAIVFVIVNFSTFSNADAFPDNVLPPEVVNIKLTSFDTEKNRAVFDVSLYNPNNFKLPVREVYGDIYLNENAIANIEALSKKSLAAHDTQIFSVPVVIKPEQLTNASSNIMLSGIAHYRFKGHMMTSVGELPVEYEDQLTKQQIMNFIQVVLSIRKGY